MYGYTFNIRRRNKVRCMIYRIIALLLPVVLMSSCSLLQFAQPQPVISPPARPEVILFKADRTNIESGSSTILYWEVAGADSIVIDGGIGQVQASGNTIIKPSELSTYNLTACNDGGTAVCSVIVNVKPFVKVMGTTTTASVSTAPSEKLIVLPDIDENESYVFYGDAVMVGADDHYVVLRNNPSSHNPTWTELKAFLQADQTDRHAYIRGQYTCGDFAETLHNNAETAGIRAGLVAIELQIEGSLEGVVNHSLNMFNTTDKGLIYIDDTSSSQGYYADKIVDVRLNKDYTPISIFPQAGQMQTWPSMGRVIAFDIQQW